ncbi:ribose ABC transporter permease [Spirochaetia bacterium]|nr:ribose ABC transporter permease [Spirochaetia bacterium]
MPRMNVKSLIVGKFGIILALVVLCGIFGIMSPIFLSWGNVSNILIQSGTNAVIAAGMTFVVLAAGIDLSVGSIVALSSVLGAMVMMRTGSVFSGVVISLCFGLLCGAINGVFVAILDFPPFIVTLSTMWLYRGSAYVITRGQAIVNLPEKNMGLALGRFLGLPYIVWLVIAVYGICYMVLSRITFGRKIYAVGDNAEAARLSGVNVRGVRFSVFTISGFLAALGGVILMSRLNSGQPVAGQAFEMSAIAAAVIGGTSLTKGGIGSIGGTLIGALFISALLNGLVILNVSAFWQQVFMGIVVLCAIGLDKYRKLISR